MVFELQFNLYMLHGRIRSFFVPLGAYDLILVKLLIRLNVYCNRIIVLRQASNEPRAGNDWVIKKSVALCQFAQSQQELQVQSNKVWKYLAKLCIWYQYLFANGSKVSDTKRGNISV